MERSLPFCEVRIQRIKGAEEKGEHQKAREAKEVMYREVM